MKKVVIGVPVSPCKEPKYTELKVTKIVISFGGGMGGANKTLYASKIVKKDKMLSIVTIFGEKFNINSDFMVYNEPIKVVKQVTDTTAHSNYHRKECSKSITTMFFEIAQNETLEYTLNVNSNTAKVILTSFEKI